MRHTDPTFEERARMNNEELMKQHDFKHKNIQEMELGDKDYFKYNAEEEDQRYAALSFEHLFRFQTTFSAIKWGVFVGSLFAFHRYYRTRDMNNAAHWFTVMSFISFFNIWVSNALQDFITDYGVRKNVATAQRAEHNKTAYQAYMDKVQDQVDYIDKELTVQPIMKNSQAESLDEFIESYVQYNNSTNNTAKFTSGEQLPDHVINNEVFKQDVYNKPIDARVAKRQLLNAIERVESIDLKSYEFELDPDHQYI